MKNEEYRKISKVICSTIYDVVYQIELEEDGHLNLAKLSSDLYTSIMEKINIGV